MFNPNRTPRPRLTLPILGYAAIDAFGMIVLAVGLAFLTRGPGVFSSRFPTTTAEAVVATVAGAALMLWSGAQILRHIGKQQMGGSDPDDTAAKD
jgi:hypothetical protein